MAGIIQMWIGFVALLTIGSFFLGGIALALVLSFLF